MEEQNGSHLFSLPAELRNSLVRYSDDSALFNFVLSCKRAYMEAAAELHSRIGVIDSDHSYGSREVFQESGLTESGIRHRDATTCVTFICRYTGVNHDQAYIDRGLPSLNTPHDFSFYAPSLTRSRIVVEQPEARVSEKDRPDLNILSRLQSYPELEQVSVATTQGVFDGYLMLMHPSLSSFSPDWRCNTLILELQPGSTLEDPDLIPLDHQDIGRHFDQVVISIPSGPKGKLFGFAQPVREDVCRGERLAHSIARICHVVTSNGAELTISGSSNLEPESLDLPHDEAEDVSACLRSAIWRSIAEILPGSSRAHTSAAFTVLEDAGDHNA